jgi:hypothetical protein
MKKNRPPWPAICAVLFLAGCTGLAPEKGGGGKDAAPPERSADAAPERVKAVPFREQPPQDLPREARSYLEGLSRAFHNRDRGFLLNQGEAQFEAEVRPNYDDDIYLALLYRIGPYARDQARQDITIPRLLPEEVDRIEYADWEERGPYLEIRGRLVRRGKTALPCLIVLVWKLREPKIHGRFP